MATNCFICHRTTYQKGLCEPHFWQKRRGKPFTEPGSRNFHSRIFKDKISWCIETLGTDRKKTGFLRVSFNDLPLLRNHRWCSMRVGKTRYGVTFKKRKLILIHRLILKAKKHEHVHHINSDATDNRRANLVAMTSAEHKSHHANNRERKINGTFK